MGASSSIGAFLYSPKSGSGNYDAREADFEIGYGTAADRTACSIPAGRLICFMTVQRDNSSDTPLSSVVYQPADPQDHIQPGNWYTLAIRLMVNAKGCYVFDWTIQKDGQPVRGGRPSFTANYGPANAYQTTFRIFCSVENFSGLWIGDHQPTTDQHAWFHSSLHFWSCHLKPRMIRKSARHTLFAGQRPVCLFNPYQRTPCRIASGC